MLLNPSRAPGLQGAPRFPGFLSLLHREFLSPSPLFLCVSSALLSLGRKMFSGAPQRVGFDTNPLYFGRLWYS